jgi:hypothetical protein
MLRPVSVPCRLRANDICYRFPCNSVERAQAIPEILNHMQHAVCSSEDVNCVEPEDSACGAGKEVSLTFFPQSFCRFRMWLGFANGVRLKAC